MTSSVSPYVRIELDAADVLARQGKYQASFRHLERAHVLGQHSTPLHVKIHWRMLLSGVRQRDLREIIGQAFRIVGAAILTPFDLVPYGNTGGANVSPFSRMTIPDDLAILLANDKSRSWMRVVGLALLASLSLATITLSTATAPPDERATVVDNHRVNFRVFGNGRPAIVMISGLGDDMTTFDGVAAELGKNRTVILYDRAGYGRSESAESPRDAVAAERELYGLLAGAGVAPPFVLSGHSLGGLTAEYYAARHPDQVAGLILEDSRPADFSRRCNATPGVGMCYPPAWMVWLMPKGARDEFAAAAMVIAQVESSAPLSGKPVLVLSRPGKVAEEASFDTVWTEAQADLAARYSGSRHLTAPAGGHYIHHDQREWFIRSVQDFLSQIRGA